jgi:hypothetical protein
VVGNNITACFSVPESKNEMVWTRDGSLVGVRKAREKKKKT